MYRPTSPICNITLIVVCLRSTACLCVSVSIDVVVQQSIATDLSLNVYKSLCMVFRPRERFKVVLTSFPCFDAGGNSLQYVSSFRYILATLPTV